MQHFIKAVSKGLYLVFALEGLKIVLLQPLHWRCVECVIHYEQDVREEQHHIYVMRTSSNKVIAAHDLYCCLLPQCEALHTCRSGLSSEIVDLCEIFNWFLTCQFLLRIKE